MRLYFEERRKKRGVPLLNQVPVTQIGDLDILWFSKRDKILTTYSDLLSFLDAYISISNILAMLSQWNTGS